MHCHPSQCYRFESILRSQYKMFHTRILSSLFCPFSPIYMQIFYPRILLLEFRLCRDDGGEANQCPGSFWAYRVGQDPSDSKSNRIHVDIFRICFHSCEVYSIDSSNVIGKFPEVLNFNRLFLKLNRLIRN